MLGMLGILNKKTVKALPKRTLQESETGARRSGVKRSLGRGWMKRMTHSPVMFVFVYCLIYFPTSYIVPALAGTKQSSYLMKSY